MEECSVSVLGVHLILPVPLPTLLNMYWHGVIASQGNLVSPRRQTHSPLYPRSWIEVIASTRCDINPMSLIVSVYLSPLHLHLHQLHLHQGPWVLIQPVVRLSLSDLALDPLLEMQV